jgi:DNA-directed RNA polymerase specialized sigma24 family protein
MLEDVRDQSDEALVAQVRQSRDVDTRAFEQLVRRHQRRVLANCRYMTNAHHDAEDLAQEVFVKAISRSKVSRDARSSRPGCSG